MHPLRLKILDTIKKYEMLSPGDRVVVGLSGGPDSVCLIHNINALADELQLAGIHAVHVNHGLRGADAEAEEQYARRLAEQMGATFDAVHVDVAAEAARRSISVEMAGRLIRYEAFEKYRTLYGAQRIAVAHNENDQAETILMRILRGTGIRGLAGIEPVRDGGHLIRPLLFAERQEIENYCSDMGLTPRIDSSNLETEYTRNRIRLELIPEISELYNPKFREALVRLGGQAAEADGLIRSLAEAFMKNAWDRGEGRLDLAGFEELHPAVAKRVILCCCEDMGAGEDLSAVVLEQAVQTAQGREPAEADLTMGWYVLRAYGFLWFASRERQHLQIAEPMRIPADELEAGREVRMKAGGRDICMKICSMTPGMTLKEILADNETALDWDRLQEQGDPVLRNRRPGDRFRPIGMEGSKKIQDLLTDRKVPRHRRDTMVLLAAGNRILLAGRETAAECAVTAETDRILVLKY